MGKWIWKYILLLVLIVTVAKVGAQEVATKDALKAAVNTSGTANIKLIAPIEMGDETLTISQGTITIDLNGQTLSATRTSNGAATCISVNGGSLYLKNSSAQQGKVTATARGSSGVIFKDGYNATCLTYVNGVCSIIGLVMFSAYPSDGNALGSNGKPYTLNFSNGKRLKDIIPYGVYIEGGANYDSEGLEVSSTTVALTQYTATFDLDGKNVVSIPDINYTIETGFTLPQLPSIAGYDMEQSKWVRETEAEEYNGVPVLTDRESTGTIQYKAEWVPINYSITYNTAEGTLDGSEKTSYTVEDETYVLPSPSRENYEFAGWYDEKGEKKERIVQGTTGDLTLTARWIPLYTVDYEYDKNIFKEATFEHAFTENTNFPYTLPSLTSKDEDLEFAGWYYNETEQVKELTLAWFQDKVGTDKGGSVTLKAKASQVYFATLHWNSDEMSSPTETVRFTSALAVDLPRSGNKRGYKFLGWCYKEDGSDTPISTIPAGIEKDIDLYAKWEPIQYALSYEYLYNGSVPSDAPTSYTIEQTVTLPIPTRSGYTFVGWHAADQTEEGWQTVVPFAFNENKDQTGDRTFYAEWKGGRQVIIKQPEGGTITVKNLSSGATVESGGVVDEGTRLEISAQPSSSAYTLDKLLVNGERFSSSPCQVVMPDSCGLTISAVFIDGRPTASKPEIETTPANTDYVPVGESVWVTLRNTDSDAKLYYSIAGSEPELYTKPFQVTSSSATDIVIQGIARKSGYKDGVASQTIKFGSDKITISFDLPAGVTALAPDGGDVISAIVSGGMFEFKLFFDRTIIDSTENIRVWANNETRVYGDASGVYRLWDQKSDVKITVSGITRKQYNVTLKQTAGGQIVFADDETTATRTVEGGDTVSVKASPNPGYYFIRWSDGVTDSIRDVIVYNNLTLSAQFSQTKKVYKVVFPEMEGVTVKTLSAYSNEVDDGGTCKFYLRLDEDYDQSQPVVYANGEELEPVGEVYSLYYIHQHYSISVRGIQKNPEEEFPFELPDNVACINMETGKSVTDSAVYADVMVTITAKAPNGKSFDKWNDNNKENPRIVKLSNASQYIPLWKESESTGCKVQFEFPAGCGIAAMDGGNAESVSSGSSLKFRLSVLPAYSQSKNIKVKVGDDILQPVTELRSVSESPTYYYVLDEVTADTKVVVSGLEKNRYKLSIEQTVGGQVAISESDSVLIGTEVILTATPEKNYMFLRWNDGNTLNPYPFVVTKEETLKAEFVKAREMVTDNEAVDVVDNRIYVSNGNLCVYTAQPVDLYVYAYTGILVKRMKMAAGYSTIPLSKGEYIVRLGDSDVRKILVR